MRTALTFGLGLILATGAGSQEWAKQRLDKSPRHQEWVKIKNGNREVECFIVFPEVKEKATSVLVIHEIFGLSDWVRSVCDQLAEAGYVAIAPDLLSGMGPNGGGTKELGRDANRVIRDLKPEQITADLNAVGDYVVKLPAANGKLTVTGYCWGGGQSFRFATNRSDLKACFVFYGSFNQDKDNLAKINCPVYGFYGENDQRVNGTIPRSEQLMKELGKTYEPIIYAGAGHGFLRMGEDPAGSPGNKKARDEAWIRMKELLRKV
jgi:carboxymethylenebutenolidase